MTFNTPASAIEIRHALFSVSCLQIGDVNATPPAFLCFCLPIMDECNYCR
jgi:hypothetical protein